MRSSSSPIELFDPGRWTTGYICPGPDWALCWSVWGVIHLPLRPKCCFPWLSKKFFSFEQVMEAAHHKAAAVRPSTAHHKTMKVRRTRHAEHCWRSRDELISDVLLLTPLHGRATAGWPARTYILQLCADTGCSPKDLPEAMNDREGWRERVKDIRADRVIWWWWWFLQSLIMWLIFHFYHYLAEIW